MNDLRNTWDVLAYKTFKCGHLKTEPNTLINRWGNYRIERCRQCHNEASRKWYRSIGKPARNRAHA